ncbi:hypothetical protein ACQU0X_30800 [Pseudovibrio ascidiaceicola]|uniref:hypothetical protein n=1 Tax=Pseudovibrio ascidiaceicola TaxID=285279 RepID=UPI003D35FE36
MNQIELHEDALSEAQAHLDAKRLPDIGECKVTAVSGCNEAIQAYLSHPEALRSIIEQSVKELEWFKLRGHWKGAKAQFGDYIVRPTEYGSEIWVALHYNHDNEESIITSGEEPFQSEKDAQAACNCCEAKQVLKLFNLGGEDGISN